MNSSNSRTHIRISLILYRWIMFGISLTLFRMGFFGAAHRWGRAKKTSLLPKICHTYPTMIKLGTVIPYLKKIQKSNGQKRYHNKAQLLLLLETSSCQIWKMAFSKWHFQSLNAAKIILKRVYSLKYFYNYAGLYITIMWVVMWNF